MTKSKVSYIKSEIYYKYQGHDYGTLRNGQVNFPGEAVQSDSWTLSSLNKWTNNLTIAGSLIGKGITWFNDPLERKLKKTLNQQQSASCTLHRLCNVVTNDNGQSSLSERI